MDKILIFFIFLGPLIFFHELGHFLFARFFGVRVEVFSIGFGPKILKWKKGFTEYALSLIPLGGYVKMFGDDPFSPEKVAEADRQYSFIHKSKWAKFWIVFGGPLANFILAFCIYFALLLTGEKVPETKFGVIPSSSSYYEIGIRSGDIIRKLNNSDVLSVEDMMIEDENIHSITVLRSDKEINFSGLSIPIEQFIRDYSSFPPQFRQPLVVNGAGQTFALALDASQAKMTTSLEEIIYAQPTEITLIPTLEKKEEAWSFNYSKAQSLQVPKNKKLLDYLYQKGFYPHDVVVSSIVMSSPAEQAKLTQGDIITKVNDQKVYSFEQIREIVQVSQGKPIPFVFLRGNEPQTAMIAPEKKEVSEKTVYAIGVWSGIQLIAPRMVETQPQGLFQSLPRALWRTWDGIAKTVDGFVKLITNQVSFKNIGGPIAIGKVASDSFYVSLSYFFRLMAIISINLGVINLFPIPVLDGGHIVFLLLETVNRGPLSKRKLEIAQQFGISLLFLLIFVALYNDFTRIF